MRNAPHLIVQRDSERNDDVLNGSGFNLTHDMIILYESEICLAHFDEQTTVGKEFGIWNLFDELVKHSGSTLLMAGEIINRSLSFASAYGGITHINNNSKDGNKANNLVLEGRSGSRSSTRS